MPPLRRQVLVGVWRATIERPPSPLLALDGPRSFFLVLRRTSDGDRRARGKRSLHQQGREWFRRSFARSDRDFAGTVSTPCAFGDRLTVAVRWVLAARLAPGRRGCTAWLSQWSSVLVAVRKGVPLGMVSSGWSRVSPRRAALSREPGYSNAQPATCPLIRPRPPPSSWLLEGPRSPLGGQLCVDASTRWLPYPSLGQLPLFSVAQVLPRVQDLFDSAR
jgi:hypothetical protein